jgi:hypothetical protein
MYFVEVKTIFLGSITIYRSCSLVKSEVFHNTIWMDDSSVVEIVIS